MAFAFVPLKDDAGRALARLKVLPRSTGSLYVLAATEAAERGEEPVQLVEGHSYEYQLVEPLPIGHHLRETPVIQPSQVIPGIGRLEPGLATGLLPIVLEAADARDVARGAVEVRTSKINYHHDYRLMLDFIATKATGLLTDIRAPSHVRLSPDLRPDRDTVHRRFALVRSLLQTRDFRDAVNRVLAAPHRQWESEDEPKDIRRGFRPSRAALSQIARGKSRVCLPDHHPLFASMASFGISAPSLPRRIVDRRSVESVDTPENRFVKYALSSFLNLLLDMEAALAGSQSPVDARLTREICPIRKDLAAILGNDFFTDIGEARVLPLGSPVLQRRSGYREVLQAWIKFNLAARVSWRGGEDVYSAGNRDVATLYEYWLFFLLVDLVAKQTRLDSPPAGELIEWTGDHFDLKVRAGTTVSLTGTISGCPRPLRVRFSYNRVFSKADYPARGSWTRPMRPDFTLSFWPTSFTEFEAERQELIAHVHFDAKYRVETISGLFGTDSLLELDEEERVLRANGAPKRADLLKMHAYRDAIRRTEGAYVIYPGVWPGSPLWNEFHEILPGLGAFAVRPGNEAAGLQAISDFLSDLVNHLCNATTRREQQSYHLFRIQEPTGIFRANPILPQEDQVGRTLRSIPEIEHEQRLRDDQQSGRTVSEPESSEPSG